MMTLQSQRELHRANVGSQRATRGVEWVSKRYGWRHIAAIILLPLLSLHLGGMGHSVLAAESASISATAPCAGAEAGAAQFGAGIVARVVIYAEPTTGADDIKLGEIACIEGEADLAYRLAQLSVGASPLVGSVRELTLPTLRLRMRQGGINDRTVEIVGPATISVRREATLIRGNEFRDVAAAALLASLPPGAEITLHMEAAADVAIPPGDYALSVSRLPSRISGTVTVDVEVYIDGTLWRKVPVRGNASVTLPVWVATQQIMRHDPIGPHNTEIRYVVVTGSMQPAQLSEGNPWRSNRIVQPGSIIEERFVEKIPDAQSGQRVSLVIDSAAIQIQARGTLLADAMIGSIVTVRNEDSGRLLSGRLVTAERVVVELH